MTESLIIEGRNSIRLAGPAEVIDPTKETAWAGPHVALRPDFGWILGRYVEANNANENGHIFGLDQLRNQYPTIVHTPLNMLHRAHHVVGAFTATELLYPIEGAAAMSAEELRAAMETARAADPMANPYVEALAAFWRYAFPDEYRAVQDAHKSGSCWYSMESVPSALECPTCPEGARTYAYAGLTSDTYCEHLNTFKAPRSLIEPHFVGGAMIIPPTRPGWKKADIKQVADVIEQHEEEAERIYEQVAASASHLEPKTWELIMAMLLAGALGPVPEHPLMTATELRAETEQAKAAYNAEQRAKLATEGKAMPNGSFPIVTVRDLRIALQDFRWAPNKADAKDHIIKRAKAIGHEGMLPASWRNDSPDPATAKDYSTEARRRMAKDGKALPDGSFPIADVADLRAAVASFGRAADKQAARRHITKRAKALGRLDLLPTDWQPSHKAAADPPAAVLDAYRTHLESLDMELGEPLGSRHPFAGGDLWQLKDGWGEWYFAADDAGVRWVAQKWPDVAAYHAADELSLTAEDVKRIGLGDQGWIDELTTRLGA